MSEDPYVYPGTTVLRNKLNIHDRHLLEQAERRLALERLEQGVPAGIFDYAHLKTIHHHLFQDIYTWAGEERRIDIAKGSTLFAHAQFIESSINKQLGKLHRENALRGLDPETFVRRVSEHYGEINAIHPFREGNGRAQRAFFSLLAQNAGYQLDWRPVERGQWVLANEASFAGNNSPLERIFSRITQPLALASSSEKNKGQVQLIQGIELERDDPGIKPLARNEVGHLKATPSVNTNGDRNAAIKNITNQGMDRSRITEAQSASNQRMKPGPYKDKAEDFKQLSHSSLLEKYPDDQAIHDAVAVNGIAAKFAQEKISNEADRTRFLEKVRTCVADNLEHGRPNQVPNILEERSKGKEELDR